MGFSFVRRVSLSTAFLDFAVVFRSSRTSFKEFAEDADSAVGVTRIFFLSPLRSSPASACLVRPNASWLLVLWVGAPLGFSGGTIFSPPRA